MNFETSFFVAITSIGKKLWKSSMDCMLIIFAFARFDIVSKLNLTSDNQDLSKDSLGLLY